MGIGGGLTGLSDVGGTGMVLKRDFHPSNALGAKYKKEKKLKI